MKLEGKIILGQFHIAQESPDFFSVNYEYENGSMTLAGSASTLEEAFELLKKRHNNEEFLASEDDDDEDDDDDDDRDENEVYFDERDEHDDRSDDWPDVRRAEY